VISEQLGELTCALTGSPFEPRGHVRVRIGAISAGERFVRDVARQDVLEDVFALAGQRRARSR
jgi:hypothetical protein